jgi:hypothetical protein
LCLGGYSRWLRRKLGGRTLRRRIECRSSESWRRRWHGLGRTGRRILDDRFVRVTATAESSEQISGSGGDRSAIMRRCSLLDACDREDNPVSLGGDDIWPDLIEIEDDAGDVGGSAVLRSADLAYAIGVNRNAPGVVKANCARKIQ